MGTLTVWRTIWRDRIKAVGKLLGPTDHFYTGIEECHVLSKSVKAVETRVYNNHDHNLEVKIRKFLASPLLESWQFTQKNHSYKNYSQNIVSVPDRLAKKMLRALHFSLRFSYLVTWFEHNTQLQFLGVACFHFFGVFHEWLRTCLTNVSFQNSQDLAVVVKHFSQKFNLVSKSRVLNIDGCVAWKRGGPRLFWCRILSGRPHRIMLAVLGRWR